MSAAEGVFGDMLAGQVGIWYAQELAPENPVYNVAELVEIRGELDADLLVEAIRRMVMEADTFHLRFRGVEGVPGAYVDVSGELPVFFVDVSGEVDPRGAAEEWMRSELRRPLVVADRLLFAFAVLKLGEDSFFWYSRSHHLVADGYSGSLVAGRAAEIYNALLEGRSGAEGALESVSVLRDADRAYRSSADLEGDREYWSGTLAGVEVRPAAGGRGLPGWAVRHVVEVDADRAARLRGGARRLRTSLAGLVIAASAVYEHRVSGVSDVVLGLPVLARSGQRELAVPGMTANVLPLRLQVEGGLSVGELVRRTSGAVRGGLRHQRYRFEEMLRDLRLVDGGALWGLEVNVVSFQQSVALGDCVTVPRNLSTGPVGGLRVSVYDGADDGGIRVVVDGNGDVYDAASVEVVAQRFLRVLEWLASAGVEELVGGVSLLDDVERHRVIELWNDTAVDVAPLTLPELFESRVA
ncbi:condensation domain-containing protein, partial [Streptomyces sp. NPDC006529]|uniref:condensation domain-containing protein n=1 Tax=Streptomyces sp. NPDC006529 TaxID=3157177 RepID=UPI0033BB41C9